MLPFASPEEKRPPYRQPLQDTDSGLRANPNNTQSTVIPFPRQALYPSGFHCGAPKTTQQRFEHVTAENVPFKIPALSYRLTTGNRYYSNVGATDTLISSGFGQRGVLRPLASASRTLRVVLPGSRGGVTLENKENNNGRYKTG